MKISILDGYTTNPGDLSWEKIEALGETTIYDRTPKDLVVQRAIDSNVLIINKIQMSRKVINQLPNLKYICVLATGTDNVDKIAAKEKGIYVLNVSGYSTESVAQHTFSLILALTNQIAKHNDKVQEGDWHRSLDFSFTINTIPELTGMTIGIFGFGKIGQKVAEIAKAFGMKIIATHRHPERDLKPYVKFVPLEELFIRSDIISLHVPLTKENNKIVDKKLLALMKPTAFLINTGRGGLINEKDLRETLLHEKIGGAALDVLSSEPPAKNHPLLNLKNCIITPHIAWASITAREKLIEETAKNVELAIKKFAHRK